MINQISELPPIIEALDSDKRCRENLVGSPLTKRRTLFGKEFCFYQDGSVLVVDLERQEYHFLTRQGREKGRELRRATEDLIRDDKRLTQMEMLGKGKGEFSKVYELVTPHGVVAVKALSPEGFTKTEFSEMICRAINSIQSEIELTRAPNKIVIQKMSLCDLMRLLKKLDEAGIRTPEFYGFTVRRNPDNNEIQEFQFMEKINRPTIQNIFVAAVDARDKASGEYDVSKLPYPDLLRNIAIKYFKGNIQEMLAAIKSSFDDFVRGVKNAVPNIGDVLMDNVFLIGYNEREGGWEFMLIDPIEEEVYIKQVRKSEGKYYIKEYTTEGKIENRSYQWT